MASLETLQQNYYDSNLLALQPDASAFGRILLSRFIGQEPLGAGLEKQVYPFGEDRVIAFLTKPKYEKPPTLNSLKSRFAVAKLAHLLMPDNLPVVHTLGINPPFMIFDRIRFIEKDNGHRHSPNDPDAVSEISALNATARTYGLAFDGNPINFLRDTSGRLVYVDTVQYLGYSRTGALEEGLCTINVVDQDRVQRWLGMVSCE